MGFSPIILGLIIAVYLLKYIRKRYIYASTDWVEKINQETNKEIRDLYLNIMYALVFDHARRKFLNNEWTYDSKDECFYEVINGDMAMYQDARTLPQFIRAFYEDYEKELKKEKAINNKKALYAHIEKYNNANNQLNKIYKDIENETI